MTQRPRTSERKFPVCDVTDKNFAAVFPEFCEVIDDADFIAIDLEFTGTIRRPCMRHCLDTPEMRYHKAREGGADHAVIQFGVSAFSWQPSTKRHSVASYNFWIFPSSADERRSRYFMCDSSSLSFLVRNGCDFNKLFREGISYLAHYERDEWCEEIRQKYAHKFAALAAAESGSQAVSNNKLKSQSEKNGVVVVPVDNERKDSTASFVNGDAEELPDYLKKAVSQIEAFLASDSPDDPKSIELDLETGYKRKQFYDLVLPRYKDVVAARTQGQFGGSNAGTSEPDSAASQTATSRPPHIKIEKCSAADRRKWLEQRQAEELAKVEKHFAFTAVVDKIREAGRPVVLHNGFLDLCLTFQHFIHPLPDTYDDFLTLYQRAWPTLYDTRLMTDATVLRDELSSVSGLGLERLYEMLGGRNICKNQLVPRKLSYNTAALANAVNPEGNSSPLSTTAVGSKTVVAAKPDVPDETELHAHMAGYDAFMTGACFVSMVRRICSLSQISPRDRAHVFPVSQWSYAGSPGAYGGRHSSAHISHPIGDILRRLQNKLFLSRSHDYPYTDLSLPLTPTTPNSLAGSSSFLKVPTRKNVFYITFPPEWGLNDIQDRFKQYGRIRVEFIDSQSAALILLDGVNGGSNDAALAGNGQKPGGAKLYGEDLLRAFLQERVNSSTDKQCQVMRYHRLMRELVKATLPATTARLQQKGKFEEFITRQITGATSTSTTKPAQNANASSLNGIGVNLPASTLAVIHPRGSPLKPLSLNPQRFASTKPSTLVSNNLAIPASSGNILVKELNETDQRLLHPARVHRASSMPRPESADKTKVFGQQTLPTALPLEVAANSISMTDVSVAGTTTAAAHPVITEPVSRRSGESVASSTEHAIPAQNDAEPTAAANSAHNQRATKRPRLSAPKSRQDAGVMPAAGASITAVTVNTSFSGAAAVTAHAPPPPPPNPYVSRYKLVRPSGTAPAASDNNNNQDEMISTLHSETKVLGNTAASTAGSPLLTSRGGSEIDITKAATTKQRLRSAAGSARGSTASLLGDAAVIVDAVAKATPTLVNHSKNDADVTQSSGIDSAHTFNGEAEAIDDGNINAADAVSPKAEPQKIMAVGKSLRRKNSVSMRVSKRKKSTSSQKE